jgi:hypothetical protein
MLLAWACFVIFGLIRTLHFVLFLKLVTKPGQFFGRNDGVFKEYGNDGQ